MHLIRAVRQSQGALAGVHTSQRSPLGHAGSTMNLDCLIDDVANFLWNHGFDGADVYPRLFVAQGVHGFRRLQYHKATGVDLDARAGYQLNVFTQLNNWLAESVSCRGATNHHLQRPLSYPNGAHAVMDSTRP